VAAEGATPKFPSSCACVLDSNTIYSAAFSLGRTGLPVDIVSGTAETKPSAVPELSSCDLQEERKAKKLWAVDNLRKGARFTSEILEDMLPATSLPEAEHA